MAQDFADEVEEGAVTALQLETQVQEPVTQESRASTAGSVQQLDVVDAAGGTFNFVEGREGGDEGPPSVMLTGRLEHMAAEAAKAAASLLSIKAAFSRIRFGVPMPHAGDSADLGQHFHFSSEEGFQDDTAAMAAEVQSLGAFETLHDFTEEVAEAARRGYHIAFGRSGRTSDSGATLTGADVQLWLESSLDPSATGLFPDERAVVDKAALRFARKQGLSSPDSTFTISVATCHSTCTMLSRLLEGLQQMRRHRLLLRGQMRHNPSAALSSEQAEYIARRPEEQDFIAEFVTPDPGFTESIAAAGARLDSLPGHSLGHPAGFRRLATHLGVSLAGLQEAPARSPHTPPRVDDFENLLGFREALESWHLGHGGELAAAALRAAEEVSKAV